MSIAGIHQLAFQLTRAVDVLRLFRTMCAT
jgi:hypothetical protein